MNRRGESLYLPDDLKAVATRKEGHRKGWNDRKEFDFSLIEEALRKSQDCQRGWS